MADSFKMGEQLNDGVYDITGIKFLRYDDPDWDIEESEEEELPKELVAFLKANPKWCWANPYNGACCGGTFFFLSSKPKNIDKKMDGDVGRGAAAVIDECPKRILILAEND